MSTNLFAQENCKFTYQIENSNDSTFQVCGLTLLTNSCKFTYPKLASEKNIQGKIILEFLIDINCSISNIKVVKGLGYGLDEIAIKMIKELEKQLKLDQKTWCDSLSKVKVPITFSLI